MSDGALGGARGTKQLAPKPRASSWADLIIDAAYALRGGLAALDGRAAGSASSSAPAAAAALTRHVCRELPAIASASLPSYKPGPTGDGQRGAPRSARSHERLDLRSERFASTYR